MFGGLAFMIDGHMCCGIVGDDLMLRLGPDGAKTALERPHVREMDFTGRPMTAMVFVAPDWLRRAALSHCRAGSGVRADPPLQGTHPGAAELDRATEVRSGRVQGVVAASRIPAVAPRKGTLANARGEGFTALDAMDVLWREDARWRL